MNLREGRSERWSVAKRMEPCSEVSKNKQSNTNDNDLESRKMATDLERWLLCKSGGPGGVVGQCKSSHESNHKRSEWNLGLGIDFDGGTYLVATN